MTYSAKADALALGILLMVLIVGFALVMERFG